MKHIQWVKKTGRLGFKLMPQHIIQHQLQLGLHRLTHAVLQNKLAVNFPWHPECRPEQPN